MTTDTPTQPASKFAIKKKLTLPTFKFQVDIPLYCLFLGAIHRGTQRGAPKKRPDGTDEEPPMLAHVVNMETGEHGQIMIAEIIRTEITESFPNDTYQGHAFAITKQKRKEGKRYDPYNIDEVEVSADMTEVYKKFGAKAADATKHEGETETDTQKEPASTTESANPENAPASEGHSRHRRR